MDESNESLVMAKAESLSVIFLVARNLHQAFQLRSLILLGDTKLTNALLLLCGVEGQEDSKRVANLFSAVSREVITGDVAMKQLLHMGLKEVNLRG